MRFSFENYSRIFERAVSRYESHPFFAKLIQSLGKPRFPVGNREVALFGIRHEGKTTNFRENAADDLICLVRRDSDGLPQVREYVGTTESGLFTEVVNPEGDFKMSPGFYYFKFGVHHGKNPCLVQSSPVLGERARKGQDFNETDAKTWQITDGSLHIHAGILNVANVGNWSAGCQVIAGGWEGKAWTEFFKYCQMTPNLPIPYVLVNEADVPGFLQ